MIRGLLLAIGLFLASDALADLPKTGGSHPTVRVEVEGVGPTQDTARQNGFRKAIEEVVGQVIVSDQEVSGDQLVKDFIGGYSAGYVDDYEILEAEEEKGQWRVLMNVAVASSKIAQRMQSRGIKTTVVDGQRHQAQLETQIEERESGDGLISTVLSSYPEHAFVINSGQTEFKVSNTRSPYVEVPYNITMSKFWIDALNEALSAVAVESKNCNTLTMAVSDQAQVSGYSRAVKNIAQRPCGVAPDMRVFSKGSGWFASANSYYFNDLKTLAMINEELQPKLGQQHIGLQVLLLDAGGNIIDRRCTNINTELFIRYNEPNLASVNWNMRERFLRPDIVGQNNVYGTLRIHIKNLEHVGELAKIKLEVQRTCGY
jgi:hypothetical protein